MANYAGVGSRIVAIIIDTIILAIIMAVIAIPFGMSAALLTMAPADPMAAVAAMGAFGTLSGLMILIGLLYFTYLEGTSGQTLGKKLMSIKVVKEDGKKPTMTDAFVRTILRIIDAQISGTYLIGFILILATEKKQRLGDIAAKTIVVKA